MADYQSDLDLVRRIGLKADEVSMARFMAQDLVIETKPDRTPVTDADKAVEEAIRQILKAERPEDGILGEEFGADITGKKRYWVIDPIDGTASFLRGLPVWSTLIALIEVSDVHQEVVVGYVSAPALSRTWFAQKGGGAFTTFQGGEPRKISVSKVSNLSDAHAGYSDFKNWGIREEKLKLLLAGAWRTRAVGDFWSHMLVAEGVMDYAAEASLALWDMAPLDLILREAGGSYTDCDGNPGPWGKSGLSTNGILKDAVLKSLNG